MDSTDWLERHKQFDSGLDADQVECRAMLEGIASVDAGSEDERISGIVDDQLTQAGNNWEERQSILETLSGATAEEIERRSSIMKEAYPFDTTGGSIQYRPSQTGVYEFCLAASRNPTGAAEGKPHASTIFEWISRDVLALHFGTGQFRFRTGWPVHESEGRGVRTKATFEMLAEKSGEFQWNPKPGLPDDPDPRHLKDIGLDIVVWKPWPDQRLAQFVAMGQCACGKHDVDARKARELSVPRLQSWMREPTLTPALRCFFAALHIPNNEALYELSKEAGLVFDRARLSLIAESDPPSVKLTDGFNYHELARFYATQKAA